MLLSPDLRMIAEAQAQALSAWRRTHKPAFTRLLADASHPDDVRRALLRERPVLEALSELPTGEPDPAALRAECAAVGTLDATPDDLAYRRLHPALDLGVYCASHAIGKPSIASAVAIREHLLAGALGIGAFEEGWLDVVDHFRASVATLVGDDLTGGDVTWFPNFSEGISAALMGLRGRLVTTEGHFTAAHYVHDAWAERTGGTLVRLPIEPDGTVPTERIVDALTPDTTVVSLSHAFYRTGFVHDLDAVTDAIARVCPDAVLLLDVYQTLGTVPVDIRRLPPHTAVLGGGVKQLRAGTGAGFGWFSTALLDRIGPDRLGWWTHADPLAFSHGPLVPGERAGKLRTGTPSLLPMVSLVAELRAFASSAGGDLRAAVARARRVTRASVAQGVAAAVDAGLDVHGGDDPDRRAAFLAVHLPDGAPLAEALAADGVVVDFRNDAPGSRSGVMRISANAAGFPYEVLYAVERLIAHLG